LSESAASPLRIVLLGPPASGKGTQGRRLAASLGLGYLSTGALLREEMEAGSPLGKLAEPILDRGEYLPDDLMCRILSDWLARQSGGWVLDGFPRSLPQAVFLDAWLAGRNLGIDAAVSLEVPFDELVSRIRNRVECPECRWSGQKEQAGGNDQCPVCPSPVVPRADDSEENFTKRYQEFVRLTVPVIDHYQNLNLLVHCDATAPQDLVAENLLDHINRRPHARPVSLPATPFRVP
jgi:adenylate kinase